MTRGRRYVEKDDELSCFGTKIGHLVLTDAAFSRKDTSEVHGVDEAGLWDLSG